MSDLLGRVGRRLAKIRRSVVSRVVTPQLARRVENSDESLIDPSNEVVVSLTSYGDRLETVHLTIESIGRGSRKPGRLILWTDPGVDAGSLSIHLQRQRARGLEVLESPANYGPHTKYYPYVSSAPHRHTTPLVTADDDSIYPRWWLRDLQAAAVLDPESVLCYRAHRVVIGRDGEFAPYNEWPPVKSTEASPLNFATGVSGVHYPASLLVLLQNDGESFLQCTPKADDVWLHAREIEHGYTIRQICRDPRKFPEIAASQGSALHLLNTGESANDAQIAATYSNSARLALQRARG